MISLIRLLRPGIVAMVLAAMAASALLATPGPPWPLLLNGLFGTALVISGAVVLNQWIEWGGDARMPRTATRPLPAGRLTGAQAALLAAALSVSGAAYLYLTVAAELAVGAVASWLAYVALYTPAKRRTAWQTPLGALAGAMPVLLGAMLAGDPWHGWSWMLFAVLFCWQLPHSMAIGWLYRDQFAAAGVKLATVVEPSGRLAGWIAFLGGSAVIAASALPPMGGALPRWYVIGALLLGHGYMLAGLGFLRRRTDAAARRLLWSSLVYLPAYLALLVTACRW